MKTILFSLIFLMLFQYCTSQNRDMSKILDIIINPKTKRETLNQAINQLTDEKEPPTFWSNISNSNTYSAYHRRLAIFSLFKRHIKENVTLNEFAEYLNKPTWLDRQNLVLITEVLGELPVQFTLDDTILQIKIFPELPGEGWDYWAVYLRIEGEINKEDFYQTIQQGNNYTNEKIKNQKLLEYGLAPDSFTQVKK